MSSRACTSRQELPASVVPFLCVRFYLQFIDLLFDYVLRYKGKLHSPLSAVQTRCDCRCTCTPNPQILCLKAQYMNFLLMIIKPNSKDITILWVCSLGFGDSRGPLNCVCGWLCSLRRLTGGGVDRHGGLGKISYYMYSYNSMKELLCSDVGRIWQTPCCRDGTSANISNGGDAWWFLRHRLILVEIYLCIWVYRRFSAIRTLTGIGVVRPGIYGG